MALGIHENFDKAFGMEKIDEEIIYIKKTSRTVVDFDPSIVRPYPGIFSHGIITRGQVYV